MFGFSVQELKECLVTCNFRKDQFKPNLWKLEEVKADIVTIFQDWTRLVKEAVDKVLSDVTYVDNPS